MKNFKWEFYWPGLITLVLFFLINDFVWNFSHHWVLGLVVYIVLYLPVSFTYDYFVKRSHRGSQKR
ncbi:unnamed protein product [Fructobacillus fructosus]|uniref:Uncharacterized protein n=1 Tax=Fructobacillus fructosus TaxID=1631 RepID=A0ABM9N1Q2_9LACO|nr:unnamed protein product [Fructobacillus fructosus]CAK1251194.1 unnamed protein product [Fructobacillus fructosus]CAK1252633.1 unnamed protein product [Fructobacillus fructosus]CAK1252713.1 unnamed protein product [Fructobacillus fructosus]CAK1254129.1 unnamed protein product [Fructobacillus fructosus]